MEYISQSALVLHIMAGYMALFSGAYIMFRKKGDTRHRRMGRIFYYSMLAVTATSVYMAIVKSLPFLLHIAIFVYYQLYGGFRSARKRRLNPGVADVLILGAALVNGAFMAISHNLVLVVFGVISILLAFLDLRIYYRLLRKNPVPERSWLVRHIGMMTGSYIGTVTAFLVVNLQLTGYNWLIWLGPTIILVPVMQYWTWKYRRKPVPG